MILTVKFAAFGNVRLPARLVLHRKRRQAINRIGIRKEAGKTLSVDSVEYASGGAAWRLARLYS